jgi:hypothetical protein
MTGSEGRLYESSISLFALPKAAYFSRNDGTIPPFCDSLQGTKHCVAVTRIPNGASHHADNYPIDKSEEKNCMYKFKKNTRVDILNTRADDSSTRVDVLNTRWIFQAHVRMS